MLGTMALPCKWGVPCRHRLCVARACSGDVEGRAARALPVSERAGEAPDHVGIRSTCVSRCSLMGVGGRGGGGGYMDPGRAACSTRGFRHASQVRQRMRKDSRHLTAAARDRGGRLRECGEWSESVGVVRIVPALVGGLLASASFGLWSGQVFFFCVSWAWGNGERRVGERRRCYYNSEQLRGPMGRGRGQVQRHASAEARGVTRGVVGRRLEHGHGQGHTGRVAAEPPSTFLWQVRAAATPPEPALSPPATPGVSPVTHAVVVCT